MARIPFRRELEDLFASDKSIILKLLAGAFVGGFASLRVALKKPEGGGPGLSMPMKVTLVAVSAVVGMFVVLLLSFRDVVARRVERGQRVNPLLRAYFGRGNGCLMLALWSVTVIIAAFVVTMLTLSF